jgi:mRNA interferase MazF
MMKRGEVWWVDFDPSVGTEIRKTRPAVIISNDHFNLHASRVQVIPITRNVERLFQGEAYITVKGQKRKAMTDQLQTASKLRIRNRIGRISEVEMRRLEDAIRVQLGLKG